MRTSMGPPAAKNLFEKRFPDFQKLLSNQKFLRGQHAAAPVLHGQKVSYLTNNISNFIGSTRRVVAAGGKKVHESFTR
jgi:hypothetical protein